MSTQSLTAPGRTRSRGRSIAAVAAALIANVILSLAVDQVLHVLDVYPPWGQPMYEPGDNLLALSYRIAFGILAGYIAARLAPSAPMRHVRVLAIIAVLLSTAGAIGAVVAADLGPAWYPIALAISADPSVWLGGVLYVRRASN
jgi:hypothetical protein